MAKLVIKVSQLLCTSQALLVCCYTSPRAPRGGAARLNTGTQPQIHLLSAKPLHLFHAKTSQKYRQKVAFPTGDNDNPWKVAVRAFPKPHHKPSAVCLKRGPAGLGGHQPQRPLHFALIAALFVSPRAARLPNPPAKSLPCKLEEERRARTLGSSPRPNRCVDSLKCCIIPAPGRRDGVSSGMWGCCRAAPALGSVSTSIKAPLICGL